MAEFSLAPMLKVTNPHFRLFMREISPKTLLFTEMIVSSTVVHVTPEKLRFILGDADHNTVVQIGGSDPEEVAEAVKIVKELGWRHFNLNCGCPSERVQHGKFGAILMKEKETVADIINTVYKKTGVIISLKIRCGVDEFDSYKFFRGFVEYIKNSTPCNRFYVHARKCWLKGVNPKQNRTIPPLCYDFVYNLKDSFPDLFISLNGGIKENELAKLNNLDGMMIGRRAVENIRIFAEYENIEISMKDIVKSYLAKAESLLSSSKSKILVPLNNIRKGMPRNKEYRKALNDIMKDSTPISEVYAHIEEYLD
ncbi:tRNA-dihydrouridine synthase A [Enteropsectra breve]|nr:tRNA-dihydrouridine synthase A [Enteropsectra breve]